MHWRRLFVESLKKMSWRGPIHSPRSRHNPKEAKKPQTNTKQNTKHNQNQKTTKPKTHERESDRLASSATSNRWWGVITLYHPYIGYGGKPNKRPEEHHQHRHTRLWVKQHSAMRKPGLPPLTALSESSQYFFFRPTLDGSRQVV